MSVSPIALECVPNRARVLPQWGNDREDELLVGTATHEAHDAFEESLEFGCDASDVADKARLGTLCHIVGCLALELADALLLVGGVVLIVLVYFLSDVDVSILFK